MARVRSGRSTPFEHSSHNGDYAEKGLVLVLK